MKKLLNTVYVNTEGAALKKDGENLVAEVEGAERARIPLHMLASVVAFGPVLLTPALIGICAERGITLVLLDRNGRFQARVEGPVAGNVLLRRAQYRQAEAGEGLVDPARLVLLLRDVLDEDATVACDIGSNYIFMARHFRVHEPRHLLFSNGQQTLGVALPWGIASALVRPGTQVVSVSGDGGFLFSVQELETAKRLGVSFTHVIMRDNTYNMVAFQEELKYGRTSGTQLGDYDVVHLAAAFGATGRRVTGYAEFEAALRESLAEDGVSIIDVAVDYSRNADIAAHLDEASFE